MAYRCGTSRQQAVMFPETIDDYIPPDHPARVYDAIIDQMDCKKFGITLDNKKVGNSAYHPLLMLKLIVYAYSYGVFSSRKIEREVYNNISFIWLIQGIKPDHKTIAEFRKNNTESLKKMIKLCAKLCEKLQVIKGNVLFIDGTKIQSNAGNNHTYSTKHSKKQLKELDKKIKQLFIEAEQIDKQEFKLDSYVKTGEKLPSSEELKEMIEKEITTKENHKKEITKEIIETKEKTRKLKEGLEELGIDYTEEKTEEKPEEKVEKRETGKKGKKKKISRKAKKKAKKEEQAKQIKKEKTNEKEENKSEDKEEKKQYFNTTDVKSRMMKSRRGCHPSYNVQGSFDGEHGLIKNIDVVSDVNDVGQLSKQSKEAEVDQDQPYETVCADAGYANTKELIEVHARGSRVIVPSQRQALHSKEEKKFSKDKFKYDKKANEYTCPMGEKLSQTSVNEKTRIITYKIRKGKICENCIHFNQCTKSQEGRSISRLFEEEEKEYFEEVYQRGESQEIYARRKCQAEHQFGHIKHNLKFRQFMCQGIESAQAEASILATTFNITRLINIFGGVEQLLGLLQEIEIGA